MIEFGKTLRAAREAKGYTISQLAEATRMIHQTIEDLENENFTKIAAPIYGRGFVKLYCEAVGLDPKPMIAEFMDIFSGNRELGIKERAPATAPVPTPATAAVPAPDPAFVPETASAAEPPPVTGIPGLTVREEPEPAGSASSANRLSRYASPLREAQLPSIPPAAWRIGVLAAGALLVLWLLGLGFKALYNATSGAESNVSGETASAEMHTEKTAPSAAEPPAAVTAAAKRDKVEVPALYVD